ncbi:phosphoribosylglycinamide formyltransferase [Paenibacillus aquistagni]|uniref:phosphoribosylglycinamide formyltransferase n=1 Tax=Paenibacillus aquistagni TaxID=1852522 RepID=UPI001F115628|nr:phosphoribosylglycinamide formyltransferase [Paenibacillus aquistagni]
MSVKHDMTDGITSTAGAVCEDKARSEASSQKLARIAIFASGSGSNFQALADAISQEPEAYQAEVALVVCDKPSAYVIERAKTAGIDTAIFQPKQYENRAAYERDVLARLQAENIDWIVLAGYMRIVTPVLLAAYAGRMLNIHPSLLPAFPGLHAIKQALDYGVRVTGVTVHLVDEGMDTGPILAQRAVVIEDGDTEDTLAERIHAVEHELYPQVVKELIQGRLQPSQPRG